LANLTEQQLFEAAIYELAITDPVLGGPGGVDNKPHQQLTNRTSWLKKQVDALIAAGGSAADITAAINAHLAALDPHAQYATDAEVNALIDARAALPANLLTNLDANRSTRDIGAADLNSIIQSGLYESAPTNLNGPGFIGWFHLQVIRHANVNNTTVKQIAFDHTSNLIRVRTGTGGTGGPDATWTTWQDIVSAGASITLSGYYKLPSGLIMQWAGGGASLAGAVNIFPISYPNAAFGVITNNNNVGAAIGIISFTKNTFTAVSPLTNSDGFNYFSIGF